MVNMSDKDLQVLIIEDEQLLNEAYVFAEGLQRERSPRNFED
jgi:hypothetical protein